MAVKTQTDIEKELTTNVVAETDKVTYFGRGGVVRAILRAISAVLSELYNDVVQIKRASYLDRAIGADLDVLGARRGLTRGGATKCSVILTFTGAAGTLIPAGTIVTSSTSNSVYVTQSDVVIGSKNPDFAGNAGELSLADSCIAESLVVGSSARAAINSLTKVAIAGVTVTNPAPSSGGDDAETDEIFRERIKDQITLLNKGNEKVYETLAKQANADVIRAQAYRSSNFAETIYVAKASGSVFSSTELQAIKTYIQSKQQGLKLSNVSNIVFTKILIEATIVLETGAVLADIHTRIADKIAAYIDWRTWKAGDDIVDDTIRAIIQDDEGVYDITNDTFKLRWTVNDVDYYDVLGNIELSETTLPRFAGLKLTDFANQGSPLNITINQRYLNQPS